MPHAGIKRSNSAISGDQQAWLRNPPAPREQKGASRRGRQTCRRSLFKLPHGDLYVLGHAQALAVALPKHDG